MDRFGRIALAICVLVALIGLALIYGALDRARARDLGQWEGQPPHIRKWYQQLMQPDNPRMSCCGEADAFEADNFETNGRGDLVAIITDGKGLIKNGTKFVVPPFKYKVDAGNPTGHGIIFIGSQGQVYCYIAPAGG